MAFGSVARGFSGGFGDRFAGSIPQPFSRLPSPAVLYDFSRGVLPSGWTWTARGGSAWALDPATGLLRAYGTTQPRLIAGGILLEPGATNYGLQSGSPTSWAVNGTTIANGTTALDGFSLWGLLTETTANSVHDIAPAVSVTLTLSNYYNCSLRVKAGTATVIQCRFPSANFGLNAWANFNLSTGQVGLVGSAAAARITDLGGGVFLCEMNAPCTTGGASGAPTWTLTNNDPNAGRAPTYVGTSKALQVWGSQYEDGRVSTSYIPTTAAAASRTTEASLLSIPFPATFAGNDGAALVEFTPGRQREAHAASHSILTASTTGRRILYAALADGNLTTTDGTNSAGSTYPYGANQTVKALVRWSGGQFRARSGNVESAPTAFAGWGANALLQIGQALDYPMTIRSVALFARQPNDQQAVRLTA